MPLLAGLLSGLFTMLADLLVKHFSKKVAFGVTAVAAFGALTVTLFGVISVAITGLTFAFPNYPGIEIAVYIAIPPAVPACISAYISADTAIALYKWNVENLKILSYIT